MRMSGCHHVDASMMKRFYYAGAFAAGILCGAATMALAQTTTVIVHDGAVFQALQDTGKTPAADHPHWILLARSGRNGCDGRTPNFCGGFDAHEKHQRLDIVEFDGSSFVALRDDPGIPGDDGWQLLRRPGSRGPAGQARWVLRGSSSFYFSWSSDERGG
jgi:hypothetical protein